MTDVIDLQKELTQNFLDFSYEANCQRAFADARDGFKPGQRACLWEMYTKGYTSNKPHVKSAKISGGTVATWWPHGTTAIYETFARMSQSWINNIPEVDWHGANGSIQISGQPAADRYTEARLAKSTEDGMFFSIKKNNVPMKLNFSEDEEWPEVLPALYPRLMVNGCQGVGSTIANVWLPHSLDELSAVIAKYVNDGILDYSDLAPSFPSGGIIINKKDLKAIYETGKGKVVLRGKVEIKKDSIFITELPYQVYVEPFIDSIKQLIIKEEIDGIGNVYNKSNKASMLIEIECDINPEKVLQQLYEKTELQKSYSANQYALVSKTPKLLNLKEYLDIYINHNYECVRKEYFFNLEKSKKRMEIVEGLIKALESIDNIISLIKKSDSSKDAIQKLIEIYSFTENQAKAIVDMKLGRLAHLEKIELNNEHKELTSEIATCEEVIHNEDKRKTIFLERFMAFVRKYPNPRRTELIQLEAPSKSEKVVEGVEPEKCVVVLTEAGNIKRIPATSFRTQSRNGKGIKTQDDITHAIIRTNTVDTLMIFSDKGKVYRISVNDVPVGTNTSKGQSVRVLAKMELGEKPAQIYSIYKDTDAKFVVFATKNGLIKKTPLEEYTSLKKFGGFEALNLREGDALASVALMSEEDIICLTKQGYAIRFKSAEVSTTSRKSYGVKGMSLREGDEVVAMVPLRNPTDNLAIFSTLGLGKKISMNDLLPQGRGGKGIYVYKPTTTSGDPCATTLISDKDQLLLVGNTNSICVSAKDIPLMGRVATGNQIIQTKNLITVSKI